MSTNVNPVLDFALKRARNPRTSRYARHDHREFIPNTWADTANAGSLLPERLLPHNGIWERAQSLGHPAPTVTPRQLSDRTARRRASTPLDALEHAVKVADSALAYPQDHGTWSERVMREMLYCGDKPAMDTQVRAQPSRCFRPQPCNSGGAIVLQAKHADTGTMANDNGVIHHLLPPTAHSNSAPVGITIPTWAARIGGEL